MYMAVCELITASIIPPDLATQHRVFIQLVYIIVIIIPLRPGLRRVLVHPDGPSCS